MVPRRAGSCLRLKLEQAGPRCLQALDSIDARLVGHRHHRDLANSWLEAVKSTQQWRSVVQALVNIGGINLAKSLNLRIPPILED
jgi:hypothetical protein